MNLSMIKHWLLSFCVLLLVGCGGGGSSGDPVVGGGSGSNTTDVSDLQVKFDVASVDNSGTENLKATITAVNANGQGVKGVPLTIKVDKNATYSITSSDGAVTGADGTVTANVTIGSDYSIRTVTMTVSTGSLPTRSASFQVTGNTEVASDLTLTAAPTISNSVANTVTVTATAVDANRNAQQNIPVTLSVDNGATIVPSGKVTNANGTVTGTLRIGQDQSNRKIKVTAVSGTVSREVTVEVTGAKLTPSGFASTVGVGTTGNRIIYLLVDNTGAKMAGYPVTVKASGLADVSGVTSVDGELVYTYVAPAVAQSLVIEANAGGAISRETINVTGTATVPVAAVKVTSPSVAASPNVVAVNSLGATTTNKVEVRALFLGTNNAPVKNVRVWFDLNGDQQSIGGTFDSTAARALLYSDVNGVARTTYAPGTRFSPKDGVTVRACWDYADFAIPAEGGACPTDPVTLLPHEVKATLTVVSESLSVSIGTNGTIEFGASKLTYVKRFVVQVVDSSGQAKAGVQIAPSVDLLAYYKGEWQIGADAWVQGGLGNSYPLLPANQGTETPTWTVGNISVCGNEDLNRNGVAEDFFDVLSGVSIPEDQNGSGSLNPQRPMLDPRKADVTIAVDGSSTTNSDGIVVLKIEYPQNLGSWVRFNVLVSASGVAGTEGRANYTGGLPVLATDVTNIKQDPPFRYSPYGRFASPAYLRMNPEGQSAWLCTNPN